MMSTLNWTRRLGAGVGDGDEDRAGTVSKKMHWHTRMAGSVVSDYTLEPGACYVVIMPTSVDPCGHAHVTRDAAIPPVLLSTLSLDFAHLAVPFRMDKLLLCAFGTVCSLCSRLAFSTPLKLVGGSAPEPLHQESVMFAFFGAFLTFHAF